MNDINLSEYTFLLVDDVRLCRLNVLGVLKNLGVKTIVHATNGSEAMSVLRDSSQKIDCVISDFNMPTMNGLQLLKAIRMGIQNIRRDLPVAMLTGHGDRSLVGLALELDVNAFLLKPANTKALTKHLNRMLSEDQSGGQWIRAVKDYDAIDVDTPVADILEDNPSSLKRTAKPAKAKQMETVACTIEDDPEDCILARDICASNGSILYGVGTKLTARHITRLQGLRDLGFWDGDMWVLYSDSDGADVAETESGRRSAPVSRGAAPGTSTLARFGRIDLGVNIPCTRCGKEFEPEQKILRFHNRGDLKFLYCAACQKRDRELLCACVRLMVMKGGFPQEREQVLNAFWERDNGLAKDWEDPFMMMRISYGDDPLSEDDILHWIEDNLISFNKEKNQLECMIDRVMMDEERVKLLGKEGLAARRMAAKRAMRRS